MEFSPQTILATIIYASAWLIYLWLVDYSPWHKQTLSYLVAQKRLEWFKVVAQKDIRILDGAIINGQMNGALFYASSSLLALGACFALLTNQDKIVELLFVAFHPESASSLIEIKIIALMCLFAYSFFKFGWSFRLFAYSAVLLGSIAHFPADNIVKQSHIGSVDDNKDKCEDDYVRLHKKIERNSTQAAHVNIQAARHFDRGQRAIFSSLPLLSWFVGDKVMIVVSIVTVLSMLRRQFLSRSVYILK